MKTAGIIAEYNPFHNGHVFQIEEVRRQTGADNIVIVMSGDFVQRGTPAFTDKYLRTEMALAGGAGFVFELPVIYSSASAGLFALGGVSLLDSLGFVDYICFGVECADKASENDILDILGHVADIITCNSGGFNATIRQFIKAGFSYPEARCIAIEKHLPGYGSYISQIIENPNNILATEYLAALKLLKSNIKPFAVKRCDGGYNNIDYKNNTGRFASAAAVRNIFTNEKNALDKVSGFVPCSTLEILSRNSPRININEDMFSDMLYYKLRSITDQNNTRQAVYRLSEFFDVSCALANRIVNNINAYNNFPGFIMSLKTRDYTYSRIARALLHIMLDIRRDSFNIALPLSFKENINSWQVVPYARLLGMDKNKSSILRNIQKTALITKTADAEKSVKKTFSNNYRAGMDNSRLIKYAMEMFAKDIFAADIYRMASCKSTGNNHGKNTCPDEYRAGIIIK